MSTSTASKMYTRDRGPFRILIEGNDDAADRNQYFEVIYGTDEPGKQGIMRSEILFVKDSRIAYNRAIVKHGRRLINVYNIETGRMVVGSTR